MEISVQESQLDRQRVEETKEEVTYNANNARVALNGVSLAPFSGDNTGIVDIVEIPKNLATVQRISSLTPIEGADKIELAKMEGLEWQVVVQKGYSVGDLIFYCQIDTILPEKPWSEFMKDRHYRVRTIRMKKVLSQGIIFPLTVHPARMAGFERGFNIGEDVTTDLGVVKYEKPVPANLAGKIKGNFPTKYLPKSDEERLQNCSRVIEELKGVPVYITVKMDGSSATYIHFKDAILTEGETHVCSRNLSLKAPAEGDAPNAFWEMERKYDILNKLKAKGNYAIQGELCGPGIQGNKMGLKELDLFVFNVYNIDERRYLDFNEFANFVEELGLKSVPVIGLSFLLDGITFNNLLKNADGKYHTNDSPREGIVIRPMVERYSEILKGRCSFKVVSNVFLEKYKE